MVGMRAAVDAGNATRSRRTVTVTGDAGKVWQLD
jgi:hypothetical protein